MLPRSQRLSVAEFNAVMKDGGSVHSPLFLLRVRRAESRGVSAVVPQKIVRTATGRNRLRRKMYEAIQPIFSSISADAHAVLFAKAPAIEAEHDVILKGVHEIFVKAGILK